jgi:hypothetical protein
VEELKKRTNNQIQVKKIRVSLVLLKLANFI